ncbi:lysophospholipid acyltransferase family protein [Luedemannella helvata]|uniref:Lysophospholipid acyltransferase family protein n=1 Tax=Luedemannella helvata TaxID=349315 RepID=A0ABN2KXG2_9ACTN
MNPLGEHVTVGAWVGYGPQPGCGAGCLPGAGAVPAAGPLRRAARYAGMALLLPVALALGAALPLMPGPVRRAAVRGWFRALLRAAGVRLVVRGVPLGRSPALVVANHVSWLDIPALLAVGTLRVVAKSDVRGWPVVGALAARAGAIFIDRTRLRGLPRTVAEVADALRSGHSVLAFPEGSTWCGRTAGRFYPAVFQAAVDARVPVRPVRLTFRLADGTATTVAAFVGDDTLLDSVRRVVAIRDLTVEVTLRRPVVAVARLSGAHGTPASRRALAHLSHGSVVTSG